MHPDDKRKAAALVVVLSPLATWLAAVRASEDVTHPSLRELWALGKLTATGEKPVLLAAFAGGRWSGVPPPPARHEGGE